MFTAEKFRSLDHGCSLGRSNDHANLFPQESLLDEVIYEAAFVVKSFVGTL